VEFIFDTLDKSFYFMEMNTRLQVEHPVTEMITGQDLVEWQLKVAAGFPLPLKQEQVPLQGHAVECRIYAEDPENGFLPGTGRITYLKEPLQLNGVRIDTGIRQGDEISTFYDPMISKLVVWAETREKAIAATHEALNNYEILGLKTNIKFCKRVLLNKTFKTGLFDTSFIENNELELIGTPAPSEQQTLRENLSVLLMHVWHENEKMRTSRRSSLDPWQSSDNFRVNHRQLREIALLPHEEAKEETDCTLEYLSETSFNVRVGKKEIENVEFF
jgi:3-methylcrotonyl-CoA carboxylase alpha subunit